jgi:hypothetical protein
MEYSPETKPSLNVENELKRIVEMVKIVAMHDRPHSESTILLMKKLEDV